MNPNGDHDIRNSKSIGSIYGHQSNGASYIAAGHAEEGLGGLVGLTLPQANQGFRIMTEDELYALQMRQFEEARIRQVHRDELAKKAKEAEAEEQAAVEKILQRQRDDAIAAEEARKLKDRAAAQQASSNTSQFPLTMSSPSTGTTSNNPTATVSASPPRKGSKKTQYNNRVFSDMSSFPQSHISGLDIIPQVSQPLHTMHIFSY
jgi:hypothetical protein